MPIYEYYCKSCVRKFDFLIRNVAAPSTPSCPICGGNGLHKQVSRFGSIRSEESRIDSLADPSMLGGLDENDPKSMARWMKKMAKETGEDMGPEFNEYCTRLEAGEDPEKLEEELGGAMEGAMGGAPGGGGYDDMLYE